MIPIPTPEQSQRVLEILGQWTKRGWNYGVSSRDPGPDLKYHSAVVMYTDPEGESDMLAFGVNHFDAICQATTAMQALLELYPEVP